MGRESPESLLLFCFILGRCLFLGIIKHLNISAGRQGDILTTTTLLLTSVIVLFDRHLLHFAVMSPLRQPCEKSSFAGSFSFSGKVKK